MWGTTAGGHENDVDIFCFQLQNWPDFLNFWLQQVSLFLFFSWLPYNIAPNWEDLTSHETKSTLFRSRLTCLVGFWFFMWSVVFRDRFPCDSWPLDLLIWFCEEWNTSITKSQRSSAGIPSMRNTNIQRNNLSFCRTVWNWSLSLARVASEHSQESTWCWFWVFKVSCKIGVLKQYCLYSLVWWVYQITRERFEKHSLSLIVSNVSALDDTRRQATYEQLKSQDRDSWSQPSGPILFPKCRINVVGCLGAANLGLGDLMRL